MPIVLNLFNKLAISIFVPTPSVLVTICGFLSLFGTFEIGSNKGDRDEKPKRQIYVNSFWIDQHELTVSKFARFVIQTAYKTRKNFFVCFGLRHHKRVPAHEHFVHEFLPRLIKIKIN